MTGLAIPSFMTAREQEEARSRTRTLLEGKDYAEARWEAQDAKDPALLEEAERGLRGEEFMERWRALEAGNASPDQYGSLAREAMESDLTGARAGLASDLLARAGVPAEEQRRAFHERGDLLVARYHEARGGMQYFEAAMKYYGQAHVTEPAVELARSGAERFRKECGFVYLNAALRGLEKDLGLPREEIARRIPLLGRWGPLHDRLAAEGWFDVAAKGKGSPATDAQFDAFFLGESGVAFGSFNPVVEEMLGFYPRGVRFFQGKRLRPVLAGNIRAWGTTIARAGALAYSGSYK